jgi:hypothetical protein
MHARKVFAGAGDLRRTPILREICRLLQDTRASPDATAINCNHDFIESSLIIMRGWQRWPHNVPSPIENFQLAVVMG